MNRNVGAAEDEGRLKREATLLLSPLKAEPRRLAAQEQHRAARPWSTDVEEQETPLPRSWSLKYNFIYFSLSQNNSLQR